MKRIQAYIILAFVHIFAVQLVDAQEYFEFTSNKTSVQFSEGRERTVLEGDAQVVSDTLTLKADYIELYGIDFRFMRCLENVAYTDVEQELTLTAGELFFDRKTKYAKALATVEVDDKKNKIKLKSEYLVIINDGKNIIAQTNIRIFREDLAARSEILQFDRDKELLQLAGFPIAYWKDDDYRAQNIRIDLKKETVSLVGQVAGVIKPGSEDETEDTLSREAETEPAEGTEESEGTEEPGTFPTEAPAPAPSQEN